MKNNRGRTITKVVVIAIAAIIVAAFALNWFMTHRLENYLRKYLADNVSELTDGFYHFTFDSLSIGFFDGELSIRGIEMYPDSAVFAQLQEKDSLPEVFFNIEIAAIDLKGINLTWRSNYRNLGFRKFEIKSPTVNISQQKNGTKVEDEFVPDAPPKDLFEIISPYFDEVSVKVMNMEKASISYSINENKKTTAVYALHNADLHTYNFVLNKNSATDPRFMYCDNIDFEADEPQNVLWNEHFKVETQHLGFNTRDSLIQVKGARLVPHNDFWAHKTSQPGNYIDAQVDLVELKGAYLTQKGKKNEFTADSLKISNSRIICFSVHNPKLTNKAQNKLDKNIAAWTLYDVVSPVLSKVKIKNLALEKAIFEYNNIKDGIVDNYKLRNYDFHANDFLLDSLVNERSQFWHCQYYVIEATGINGRVNSKNYNIALEKMLLNTYDKHFRLNDIRLSKLDTLHNENRSYVTGTISFIDLSGLQVRNGISATALTIQQPQVQLYIMGEDKKDPVSAAPKSKGESIWSLFVPYTNYFQVKSININNANVTYNNLVLDDNLVLKNFFFYAKDFLVNDKTKRQPDVFFTLSDFGFQFSEFDNLLPGKNYRLQIKEAELSHIKKYLLLKDVVLTPQTETWKKAPDMYFNLSTPQVRAQRSFFDSDWTRDSLNLMSLSIDSLQLAIVKTRNSVQDNDTKTVIENGISGLINQFGIGVIHLDNTAINYNDLTNNSKYNIKLSKSTFDSLRLSTKGDFALGGLLLTDAKVNIGQNLLQASLNLPSLALQGFRYNGSDTQNSHLSINVIDIPQPVVNVDIMKRTKPKPHKTDKSDTKTIYDIAGGLASEITIGRLNMPEAKLNFVDNNKPAKNEMGNTSLFVEELRIDSYHKTMDLGDIRFATEDLRIPLSNGFYTLFIDKFSAGSKQKEIRLDNLHFLASYPKEKFAYVHPKGKDWFDFKAANITLSGIDVPSYFGKGELRASYFGVHDAVLSNFKNQKIDIEHNKMPLIYEMLQNTPLKFAIDSLDVSNFSVVYEELARKGKQPGTISFSEMNGRMSNLTNIATQPNQMMALHVDGKFMNTGGFDAVWQLPVSKDYDRFLLDVRLSDFPLTDLNQIFMPLASAKVNSGYLKDVTIKMDASSEGASSNMLLLYNDLSVSLYKDTEMQKPNKLANKLASLILKKDNPDKGKNKQPRQIESTIVRDKYHSTFNYLWQIIQPPLIESVGVSQRKQKMGMRVASFVSKIKNIFHPNRNKKEGEEKEDKSTD